VDKNSNFAKKRMKKDNEIIEKLEKIEASGDTKDVDILIDSIISSNKLVSEKAYYILCNVKKTSAVEKIIKKIKKSEKEKEKILLTSICWQSSLDFSPYIELFVELAINGSLELTIESFSTIENILDQNIVDKTHIKSCLNTLEEAVKSQKNEKLALLKELINVLNKI